MTAEGFGPQGLALVKFFFLATFAAAVPAIVSGGIAERTRFLPQAIATAVLVALAYPLFEGIRLGRPIRHPGLVFRRFRRALP